MQGAGVYVLVSPFTKHYYIGSTKDLPRRWYQHMRAPADVSRPMAPVHRMMSLLGTHAFVMIPLLHAGPLDDLLALEQRFIRILQPSLNVRHRPCKHNCRPSARRRWRSRRQQALADAVQLPSLPTPAWFQSQQGFSFDLCSQLRTITDDHKMVISCFPGLRLSDVGRLRCQFGHLFSTLQTAEGQQHSGTLKSIFTHLPHAVTLCVSPGRPHDPEATAVELLLDLLHHHGQRRALYTCTLRQLLALLRACRRLPRDDAMKCKLALHKACVSRFGFDLRPITLRMPVWSSMPDRLARATCRQILTTLHIPQPLLAHTLAHLRIVRSTPTSLGAMLCNHRHAARARDAQQPPACQCHRLRGLLPVDESGHVCFRGNDPSNVFLPVLAASAKTVPHVTQLQAAASSRDAFVRFWRTASMFGNTFTPASVAAQLHAIPETQSLLHFQQSPPPGALTRDAALITRAALRDLALVCVPLDRNINALFVECVYRYWQRVDALFVRDAHYERVPTAPAALLRTMRDQFCARSWEKRAAWNASGSICTSYALPKHKDPVRKSRPVVPAHRHPARRLLQAISLVLMRLIAFQSNQAGHFNILATKDVVPALQRINAAITHADGDTQLLTFDVKNMFTELPHPDIRTAAAHFLQWSQTCRAAAPDCARAVRCNSWLVNLSKRTVCASRSQYDAARCVLIRLADIMPAIEFELQNIYFTVGAVTLRQTVGISMGGYLSPAMAMMTCIMAERHMYATLGADARFLHGIRYMDDGTLVIRVPRTAPALASRLMHAALHAYPRGMQCEITGMGQRTRMLEQRLVVRGNLVAAAHHNKNSAALFTRSPAEFVSFLPASASNGAAFFDGWIKGSCSRILYNTSKSDPDWAIIQALVLLFLESTALGYPKAWFHRALTSFRPKLHVHIWAQILKRARFLMGGL
jgi:hypothetical protein